MGANIHAERSQGSALPWGLFILAEEKSSSGTKVPEPNRPPMMPVVMPRTAAHATASAHHPYRGAQREHGVQETVGLICSPLMQCHDAGVKTSLLCMTNSKELEK